MHCAWGTLGYVEGGFNVAPPIYHYVSRKKIAGNFYWEESGVGLFTGIVNNQEGIDW